MVTKKNRSGWPWRRKKREMVATERLKLATETDEERKEKLEKMVATTQLILALEIEGKNGSNLICI